MSDRIALAVDDVSANREFLERLLTGAHFKVLSAGTGSQALKLTADLTTIALAMVDMKLPDMTGLELVTKLRERFPDTYIVVATMMDDHSVMDDSFKVGCNAFLVKPHGFMELYKRLTNTEVDIMKTWPQVIIDQFGPRLYKTTTQVTPKVPRST